MIGIKTFLDSCLRGNDKWRKCVFIFLTFFFANTSFAFQKPLAVDSRIKTLIYSPNEIFSLKFHLEYQSIIEFSEDEEIELVSLGDPFPWKLTPVGRRLFIKALEPDAKTNMTIMTSRRMYLFEIKSEAVQEGVLDEEVVYVAKFFYPEIEVDRPKISGWYDVQSPARQPFGYSSPPYSGMYGNQVGTTTIPLDTKANSIGMDGRSRKDPDDIDVDQLRSEILGVESKALNFNYSYAGFSEDMTPVKVFDDGKKTYLKFKSKKSAVPSIYIVDENGNEFLARYHMEGEYVIIDETAYQLALRSGNELVCVFNDGAIKGEV